MCHVIEFPAKTVRTRIEIERSIRQLLESNRVDESYIETILGNMHDFIRLLDLDFELPHPAGTSSPLDGQLGRFSAAMQERTNQLIFERLTVEVENLAYAHAR